LRIACHKVAGHFVGSEFFCRDDFVVGEREKEIFGEGVEERKSEFVVSFICVDGGREKKIF